MAISPRLSTARLGAASCPRGGPAPIRHGRCQLYRDWDFSDSVIETTRRRDNVFRVWRRIFFDARNACSTKRAIAPADIEPAP